MKNKINDIEVMLNGLHDGGDVTDAAKSSLQYTVNEAKKEALTMHAVSSSYNKDDLRVAFEQSRCNKHSFEDWYKFNYC